MTNTKRLLLLRRKTWFIGLFQAALVTCSLLFAWLLRFDFSLPYRRVLLLGLPVLLVVRLAAMAYFGLFRGWWRYSGVLDVLDVFKAIGVSSLAFWVVLRFGFRATSFPRSIYILEAVLTTGLLIGVRLFSRALAESVQEDLSSCKRVILIGAGAAAQTILREIRRSGSGYAAIGCLDDDRSKLGVRIQDIPVIGRVENLPELVSVHRPDEILIAVPSATGSQMSRFVTICSEARVAFKTMPALRDIIAGQITVSQLREVSLEDLLGREPVRVDLEAVRREIEGRTVLVTGAAGSIGSELCRQILAFGPARLICLDQSETGLFYLRLGLDHGGLHSRRPEYRVADICDAERMHSLFKEFKPEIVFHAAAYKHVPLMESNVQEAVKNNVLGFLGLLDVADANGCKNFVLISSDKAVNPTNVMGATKRICELILSSRPVNGMCCTSVRFGNVLGSNGSVIPVLKRQLRNHEPLTITHPEIKRYFMTTPEAVALVLQAFTIGRHGDTLVLDMGDPIRILDMARTLIRLSGKSEGDVQIRFTGLREGEKLTEELFYEHEGIITTSCEKIKRTTGTWKKWHELQTQLAELRASMSIDGAGPVRAKIREIVPEYSFDSNESNQVDAEVGSTEIGYFRATAGHD